MYKAVSVERFKWCVIYLTPGDYKIHPVPDSWYVFVCSMCPGCSTLGGMWYSGHERVILIIMHVLSIYMCIEKREIHKYLMKSHRQLQKS